MDVGVAVVLSVKSSRDIMDYTSECLHVSLIVELNDGALVLVYLNVPWFLLSSYLVHNYLECSLFILGCNRSVFL